MAEGPLQMTRTAGMLSGGKKKWRGNIPNCDMIMPTRWHEPGNKMQFVVPLGLAVSCQPEEKRVNAPSHSVHLKSWWYYYSFGISSPGAQKLEFCRTGEVLECFPYLLRGHQRLWKCYCNKYFHRMLQVFLSYSKQGYLLMLTR